jgi:hypothetical protein
MLAVAKGELQEAAGITPADVAEKKAKKAKKRAAAEAADGVPGPAGAACIAVGPQAAGGLARTSACWHRC